MRKLSSGCKETVRSIEDIEPPAAVAVACAEIRRFLTDVITKKDTDVIISTLRKGSWIIDDILRVRNLKTVHYTNGNIDEIPFDDLSDAHILVFDDSVHTGQSITDLLSRIGELRNVRVACIAINDGAVKEVEKRGVSVEYFERFRDYALYGDRGELIPDCQAYYYTYFMIPYISNLSVNYSPDYKSLSIVIWGSSPKDLKLMTDSVVNAIECDGQNDSYVVDSTQYTRRVSLIIGEDCLESCLSDLKIPHETDTSKIRVSASAYGKYSEIVVTPMFCPICGEIDEIDIGGLPFFLSERFIRSYCERIMDSLTKSGLCVVQRKIIIGTAGNLDVRLE